MSFQTAGTCKVDFNQAGNGTYNAATQVQQSFTVGKGAQTITPTSTAPASASVGGPTYTPTATASSGLTVAITIDATSSSVCSITAGAVSYLASGTCTIDFNQAGNANYNAAPQVQQAIPVGLTPQTITITSTAPGGHGRWCELHHHRHRWRLRQPGDVLHRRLLDGRGLLDRRRRGQLHRGGQLHHRCQPGR